MVQGKNSDVHKGMKSHRNVKHVCKYMTSPPWFLNFFKGLFKEKIITVYYGDNNKCRNTLYDNSRKDRREEMKISYTICEVV